MARLPRDTATIAVTVAAIGVTVAILQFVVGDIALPFYFNEKEEQRDRSRSAALTQNARQETDTSPSEGCELLRTVTSQPTALPGEMQRSSSNFNLGSLPPDARTLRWRVEGEPAPRFDVLQDVSFGIDRVVFDNLADGSETAIDSSSSLYIANPEDADRAFRVTVLACP